MGGSFTAYFADARSEHDFEKFGCERGDCAGQQTWECLTTLVALRLWLSPWRHLRVCLRVRSDPTTASQLLLTLKSSGRGPTLVGKERALDLARGSYRPNIPQHLPGVANAGPDALSRLAQPGAEKSFPAYLVGVPRSCPPTRDADYYLTGVAPDLSVAPQLDRLD